MVAYAPTSKRSPRKFSVALPVVYEP